jgi:hypothetical protein
MNKYQELEKDWVSCEENLLDARSSLGFCNGTSQFNPKWYQNDLVIIGMVIIALSGGIAIGASFK